MAGVAQSIAVKITFIGLVLYYVIVNAFNRI